MGPRSSVMETEVDADCFLQGQLVVFGECPKADMIKTIMINNLLKLPALKSTRLVGADSSATVLQRALIDVDTRRVAVYFS